MERSERIRQMKRILLSEVSLFVQYNNRHWKQSVVDFLHELAEDGIEAVLFGGVLRSLLASRIYENRVGRPRDIDLVIIGESLDGLRKRFKRMQVRENRFGGLKLLHNSWQFDLWPLESTWAFANDSTIFPKIENLPSTTFFNLEAIAVDVIAQPGRSRKIFSGNDQFFTGIIDKVLEINRENNPFPDLCVVRALNYAISMDLKIGPQLATYISLHGLGMSNRTLEGSQKNHFGYIRLEGSYLHKMISYIDRTQEQVGNVPIALPIHRQLILEGLTVATESNPRRSMVGVS